MNRLLKIVEPDHLFMGQKDYQQCMVVKEMIRLSGIQTVFHTIPTTREASGLAMSSRNLRLTEENRAKAASIYKAMQIMKEGIAEDLQPAVEQGQRALTDQGFKIDYLEFADASTLEPQTEWDGQKELVILAAAFLQDVRLIDNLLTAR
jgi:pantoate--beta-alanine ligase